MPTEVENAVAALKHVTGEVKGYADKASGHIRELDSRVTTMEQKSAMHRGGGRPSVHNDVSWGAEFTKSAAYEAFKAPENGFRGVTPRIEVKSISSVGTSAGSLVRPDIDTTPVQLPYRPMTIRDLCGQRTTLSNSVWYPRQTLRDTEAATVAEDPSAPKPMSNYTWQEVQTPVRTLAHWVPVTQQAFDDAPGLSTTIDTELRYGLRDIEEQQLLSGDGTGTNLFGIIPQATAFDTTLLTGIQSTTAIDILLMAAAQAETALLPATGVVLHPLDWAAIWALKDSQNRYLAGGPLADALNRFWSIPRVSTIVMTRGTFLVGAFADGAWIYDRQLPNVLASSEDRDNFIRNLVTVRAEERLAFAVRRPNAFITGSLTPPASK